METAFKVTIVLFMILTCYRLDRLEQIVNTKQTEPFHICAMCETKIDTVNDKAIRQWLYDTPARLRFKKMLIEEDAKNRKKQNTQRRK